MTFVPFALGLLASVGGSLAGWVKQEEGVAPYSAETSSWVVHERAPTDHSVVLTVALRVDGDRLAELERIFWEVSDPKHIDYGKYRSVDEITQILAVPQQRIEVVKSYFEQAGAKAVVAPNGDMITLTMSVAAAEKSLNTILAIFKHPAHAGHIVRAFTHYHLPAHVAEEVTMVGELLQFPGVRHSLRNLTGSGRWPNDCEAAGCKGLVTPNVLAQRYKLPASTANAANNSMAVAEYQGQGYAQSDLKEFAKSCHRDVTVANAIGENPGPGVEAELDIEYIKAVAPEIPLTVIYNDEYSLLQWANQITSMEDAPLVHSVSYGNDEKQQSSAEYIFTCNTAFMKAGVHGLSILFASGDQGVCGRQGCGMLFHAPFHPDFPADSPYITAVGGTDFKGSDVGEETAWQDSGGGFSNYFGIPSYQQTAVAAYKASPDANLPPRRLWNNSGRGYPDVAALGGEKNGYCVDVGGMFSGVAGTSASCPVVAGVFAKLNGLRLKAGKPAMGFLNPFIYQNPDAFQDVTSGKNTGSPARKYGFTAIKGWDAATGLGTPDFEALAKAAVAEAEAEAAGAVVV